MLTLDEEMRSLGRPNDISVVFFGTIYFCELRGQSI